MGVIIQEKSRVWKGKMGILSIFQKKVITAIPMMDPANCLKPLNMTDPPKAFLCMHCFLWDDQLPA